jgi:hypothetical protein
MGGRFSYRGLRSASVPALWKCLDMLWLGTANQQEPKGLDFFRNEITKRSHPRSTPHDAMEDQVEVQTDHVSRTEQLNKICLMRGGGNRERSQSRAGSDGQYKVRCGRAHGGNVSVRSH